MKKNKFAAGAGILLLALMMTGCAGKKENSTGEYKKLKPEEAKARIEENTELVLVDVRTAEEYGETHIGGAINIPLESIVNEEPEMLPDKDAEILVYCRSGVRSKRAADKLLALGYTKIEDIGGIIDWPYETVAGKE